MTPGVRKSLVGSVVLAALLAVAGCSHYMLAERDSWRHEAEETCINSGVPQEVPGRVRISTISGPGACGIDYPLKVSELGVSGPLGYDDEPMQPPGSIPNAGPRQWPVQSQPLPPPQHSQASPYGPPEGGPPPYDAGPYGSSVIPRTVADKHPALWATAICSAAIRSGALWSAAIQPRPLRRTARPTVTNRHADVVVTAGSGAAGGCRRR